MNNLLENESDQLEEQERAVNKELWAQTKKELLERATYLEKRMEDLKSKNMDIEKDSEKSIESKLDDAQMLTDAYQSQIKVVDDLKVVFQTKEENYLNKIDDLVARANAAEYKQAEGEILLRKVMKEKEGLEEKLNKMESLQKRQDSLVAQEALRREDLLQVLKEGAESLSAEKDQNAQLDAKVADTESKLIQSQVLVEKLQSERQTVENLFLDKLSVLQGENMNQTKLIYELTEKVELKTQENKTMEASLRNEVVDRHTLQTTVDRLTRDNSALQEEKASISQALASLEEERLNTQEEHFKFAQEVNLETERLLNNLRCETLKCERLEETTLSLKATLKYTEDCQAQTDEKLTKATMSLEQMHISQASLSRENEQQRELLMKVRQEVEKLQGVLDREREQADAILKAEMKSQTDTALAKERLEEEVKVLKKSHGESLVAKEAAHAKQLKDLNQVRTKEMAACIDAHSKELAKLQRELGNTSDSYNLKIRDLEMTLSQLKLSVESERTSFTSTLREREKAYASLEKKMKEATSEKGKLVNDLKKNSQLLVKFEDEKVELAMTCEETAGKLRFYNSLLYPALALHLLFAAFFIKVYLY